MGLRSLYTILSKAASDIKYLEPAVGVVLGFIGSKMIAEYFGVEIPTAIALGIVASCLSGGVALSVWEKTQENYSPWRMRDNFYWRGEKDACLFSRMIRRKLFTAICWRPLAKAHVNDGNHPIQHLVCFQMNILHFSLLHVQPRLKREDDECSRSLSATHDIDLF